MRYLAILLLLTACSVVTPEFDVASQATGTLAVRVKASADDAEQNATGVSNINSTSLEMGELRGVSRWVGYRFDVGALPEGADITAAYIQYKAYAANSSSATHTWRAQVGNAARFTTATNTITSRTLTAAASTCSAPADVHAGDSSVNQRSCSLVEPLEEALQTNTSGYVALVMTGTGLRRAYSYNGNNPPELVITYTTPEPQPAVSTPTDFSASQLKGSVGINIHETYDDTAYYDVSRILTYLQDLGITWVRSGVHKHPRSWHPGFLRDLQNAGFKLTLGIGDPAGTYGNFATGDSAAAIESLNTTYSGIGSQFEFPNEWDCFSPTGSIFSSNPEGWLAELNAYYDEYYKALKQAFPTRPYVGPSFCRGSSFGKFTKGGDAANLHPYAGGQVQEIPDIANQISTAKTRTQTQNVIATEWGYHNATNCSSNCQAGVPEDVAAHYLLRGIVWMFAQGVDQSYIYQLFDQKPNNPGRTNQEEWFGLVAVEGDPTQPKSTWTLRKKPGFYAVDRLMAYLVDSGAAATPDKLPFTMTLPSNALSYAIVRRDGSYDVAVWLKNALYDRNNHTAIADTSAQVTFTFATASDVDAYRPSVSGAVVDLGSDGVTQSATIDGKLTLFRVTPNR